MSRQQQSNLLEPCGLSQEQLRGVSDENLMAHLQAGHADVLAIIFDRYYRLVLSVALKILRDVGEAEDLMQGVFLEIYKSAVQFDASRGTLKVWILQYAYHRAMSRRQHLSIRNFYTNVDIADLHLELTSTEVTHFNDHEIRQLVMQGLGRLSESQSKVLKLAYFEGLSLKEISDRIQEDFGNVRHHYYRGLKKLREVVTSEPTRKELRFSERVRPNAKA